MPYEIIKNKRANSYRVINSDTGIIHAMHSSLRNAEKQVRLLNMLENHHYKFLK